LLFIFIFFMKYIVYVIFYKKKKIKFNYNILFIYTIKN
jgi:hypothetical protein